MRRMPGPDGCRRSHQASDRRDCYGAHPRRRRQVCHSFRHFRSRRCSRRHGLQNRRRCHGITAFQLDIKVEGINKQIMKAAVAQAKQGLCIFCKRCWKSAPNPKSIFQPTHRTSKLYRSSRARSALLIGPGGQTNPRDYRRDRRTDRHR